MPRESGRIIFLSAIVAPLTTRRLGSAVLSVIFMLLPLLSVSVFSKEMPSGQPAGPHAGFSGTCMIGENPTQNSDEDGSVRIGFLVQDTSKLGREAIDAAQLAINKANEQGGFKGKAFELVVKTCEGPWGVGSKASVSLVYDDEVRAIVGSLDGRNAHLAEQVAAKGQTVFISTRATDPTLSRAYVPWYFRCVPDDRQQAEALVHEISKKHGLANLILLAEDNYDCRMAANSFQEIAEKKGFKNITAYYPGDIQLLPGDLKDRELDVVVLFGKVSSFSKTLESLRLRFPGLSVFGSLSIWYMDLSVLEGGQYGMNVSVINPGYLSSPGGSSFMNEFSRKFGYVPGAAGAFAYDGINLIILSILKAGLDRQLIREALMAITLKNAVTGQVGFDQLGNRLGPVDIIQIKVDSIGY